MNFLNMLLLVCISSGGVSVLVCL
uniref:Uncharacterized protein n=1 Tax=Arundo donax TaxID=35708 RepID=A0A0A8YDG7_ARUDO